MGLRYTRRMGVVPLTHGSLAPSGDNVRALPFRGDNAALVAALLRGSPGAAAAFHDRYAHQIHGLLFRMLGPDPELEDTLHDVFVRALEALPALRDPAALDSWIMGVAVRTVRTRLQRRARRWWLKFLPAENLPEPVAWGLDPASTESLRAVSRILDKLLVDERIALVLRFAAEMTVAEAAAAAGVSMATLKRRVARAERRFLQYARSEPALGEWLNGGER